MAAFCLFLLVALIVSVRSVKRILCLGQALASHDSLPVSLQSRCNAALELALECYLCNNEDICMVLSGSDVSCCGITEAIAMEEYIRNRISIFHQNQHTCDPSKVADIASFELRLSLLLENQAKNTIENMICSKELLLDSQSTLAPKLSANKSAIKPVLYIVTNNFHMPRALLFAQHVFNDDFDCHAFIAESHQWGSSLAPREKVVTQATSLSNYGGFEKLIHAEKEGILAANNVAAKYKLPAIKGSCISNAIDQLEVIKESYLLRHQIKDNYLGKRE